MNLAAMLGHRLHDFNIYAIVDLTAGQTMSGMAELVRRRVLRDGLHGLEFVNEMVRTAAYLGVPVTLRKVLHGKIADRFVEEHSRGDDTLALEIAWHSIRAGRGVEATPYLLSGARDAIARGALHEAEYSLTTALPHLAEAARCEGLLLIVEVLQDQGRWEESTYPLQDAALGGSHELASVFSIMADHRTMKWPAEKLTADVTTLEHIVQTATNSVTRVRAVRTAAHLLADLRDERLSARVLEAAEMLPTDQLRPEYVDELELSKAQLLYQSREHVASLARVMRLTSVLESRTTNSFIVNLYSGLGAIYCSLGRYSDAQREFGKGHEVAQRLTNDSLRGAISAQLALCAGRLGDYEGQLYWSNAALSTFGRSFTGYCELQAAYYASFAYAMTGHPQRALDIIATWRSRVPPMIPAWLTQASLLFQADILHLTDQTAAAVATAREAFDYKALTLHSASFAGPFVRWLAKAALDQDERCAACLCLNQIMANLDRHDALDQAEIVCACLHLGMKPSCETFNLQKMLAEKLGRLPNSISEQICRLGFHLS